MYQEIRQAISSKIDQAIVIIGQGPSIDAVDLSLIEGCIIINTNIIANHLHFIGK